MTRKKTAGLLIIAIIFAVFFIFSAATPIYYYRILLDSPLYADPDFESEKILNGIKRNEPVEVIGEPISGGNEKEWVKIRYNEEYEGYIPYSYLYKSAGNEDYDLQVVKATGKSTSEEIYLYSYYDETSDVIAKLVDGEKLDLIIDGKTYGEFSKVVYEGKTCFVKTEKITTGLTYNQRLALIISAALITGLCFVGIAVVLFIRSKKKNRATEQPSEAE